MQELRRWNHEMDRASVAALIYDKWELAMLNALNEKILPGQSSMISRVKLRQWMLDPPVYVFGHNPVRGRDRMTRKSLDKAVNQLTDQFGPDLSTWQYGRVHVAEIEHPLSKLTSENLDAGPLPRGGASNTLNANRGNDRQLSGGTFRIIVDTADWDRTMATNSPGQSGNPASPHYRDLFTDWNEGRYFPLYFSREKIESVVEEQLLLLPEASGATP